MMRWRKLEISGGFLLTVSVLLYLDARCVVPWALMACAAHEWGHYAAVGLMGGQVTCLRLTAAGGEMRLASSRTLSYGRELVTVLAGPLTNLGIALVLTSWNTVSETVWLFAGLNLIIGLFNLLPAEPLDGGRALRLLILLLWTPHAAERITRAFTVLTLAFFLAAGAALLWNTKRNFTLLVTAVWLLWGKLKAGRQRPRREFGS